ncbi:hypothetical protein OFEAOIEE_LOCUS4692 [Methylorubrum extorquens]
MGHEKRWPVISALGVVQILAWGSSFYLLGVLAAPIADDTGWPLAWVFGGLTLGLLVAGLVSPTVGRIIGERGGRAILAASALLLAAGLVVLGLAPSLWVFLGGWLLLGLGMGCGLYDPAFATLSRLYVLGPNGGVPVRDQRLVMLLDGSERTGGLHPRREDGPMAEMRIGNEEVT